MASTRGVRPPMASAGRHAEYAKGMEQLPGLPNAFELRRTTDPLYSNFYAFSAGFVTHIDSVPIGLP